MKQKKRIVVIGGGTGAFMVLSGLKQYPVELSAVITMADDGGSTGRLRDEMGVLPPGDVRRCLVALSESDELLRKLFDYRFDSGDVKGHTFGNLFLTALERMNGNFEGAIKKASEVLRVRGEVVPITLDNTRLVARLKDGQVIRGETNIDVPKHDGNIEIDQVWLDPAPRLNPRVKKVINRADAVVIGPGDIYTSIVPNLLVGNLADILKQSSARVFYVPNLVTKFGETNTWHLPDFMRAIEQYVGSGVIDTVFYNTREPNIDRIKHYKKYKNQFVGTADMNLAKVPWQVVQGDYITDTGLIRHDSTKLAAAIFSRLVS